MANVTYTSLRLKVNTQKKTFNFNGTDIEVLKYLPISDKKDLIQIALQHAAEDDMYNPVKLKMYFNLYLVYMYTNISFTEKQREDEYKLYDALCSNGFFDALIPAIEESEMTSITEMLEEMKEDKIYHDHSTRGVVDKILTDMPKNAKAMQEIVNDFDKQKYMSIISTANELGMQ